MDGKPNTMRKQSPHACGIANRNKLAVRDLQKIKNSDFIFLLVG